MRIGIFGFKGDPLHVMHLILAERARSEHNLDLVYFVLAGQPVDKDPSQVTEKELRYDLMLVSTASNDKFVPSRIEVDRTGPSYMVDTVREIRKIHGDDHEYFLIIGGDRVSTLKKWHKIDELIKLVTFLVGPRLSDDVEVSWLFYKLLGKLLGKKNAARLDRYLLVRSLPRGARYGTVMYDFSSTFIRNERAAGRSVRYMLPDQTLSEIDARGAYPAKAPQR